MVWRSKRVGDGNTDGQLVFESIHIKLISSENCKSRECGAAEDEGWAARILFAFGDGECSRYVEKLAGMVGFAYLNCYFVNE
jgi:hypothetical protein